MTTPLTAVQALGLAQMLIGALHRIRTSLEKSPRLDATLIGSILIRCRSQIWLAMEPPVMTPEPGTAISSKESMGYWVDLQLHLVMELIESLSEPTAASDPAKEASPREVKMLMAVGYAIHSTLASSTFESALAATVQ
ncbi:MAG: hypothetical protein AAB692_00035 [Patescibacteria group bacterium]